MILYKLIQLGFGIFFGVMGYRIFFKEHFHLVGGFDEKKKDYKGDPMYARRVGLIELFGGILNLLLAGVGFLIASEFGANSTLEIILLVLGIVTVFVGIGINEHISSKK